MRKYGSALVLGMGRSGDAAVRLLSGEGTHVVAVDSSRTDQVEDTARKLNGLGVRALTGVAELDEVLAKDGPFDVCVTSPGIAAASNWHKACRERGVPVISELELGFQRCRCPLLAVTGSNGKSTLVKLCCEILQAAGRKAEVAGNYGIPLCRVAPKSADLDWMVTEVSSFQLETVSEFKPRVAILLNLTANHLDRHSSEREYLVTKSRIFARMGGQDRPIVADELIKPLAEAGVVRDDWITFGTGKDSVFQYMQGKVVNRAEGGGSEISIRGSMFDNPILGPAAASATAAVWACGEDPGLLAKVAMSFQPLDHRMQKVREIDGVTYINNSKATTLAAVDASLLMAEGGVRLLAGGQLKEHELGGLKKMLARKAKGVYLFGRDARLMADAWNGAVPCSVFADLASALEQARKDAKRGESVLLAPGCASFDQYKNFEERGGQFIRLVKEIRKEM